MSNAYFKSMPLPPGAMLDDSYAPSGRRLGLLFVLAFLFVAAVKLWLIHGDEIIARNAPLDDLWYLTSAKAWYWNRPYDHYAFMRPPVYPLFVAISTLTAIPLRVTSELLLLGAAFVFAGAGVKAGISRILAVLVFAAIALCPWSFDTYSHPTPDTLYAPLLLLATAAMALAVTSSENETRIKHSLLAGLWLGLLFLTREEKQLVPAYVACWFVVALIARPLQRFSKSRLWMDFLTTILLPGAVIGVLVAGVSGANFYKWGVFATSEVSSSGFEAANRALVRIKPETWVRYVPVTKQARQTAYTISPTMAQLQPIFESSRVDAWGKQTREMMGVQDEIAAPWFMWYFRDVVAAAGHGDVSAKDSNAFYKQIAGELNTALDNGKAPSRSVMCGPFVDPEIKNYAPYFRQSFVGLYKMFFLTRPAASAMGGKQLPQNEPFVKETDDANDVTPENLETFDEMCCRRAIRPKSGQVQLSGWAFDIADPIERIDVYALGKIKASIKDFIPRPDVAKSAPDIVGIPIDCGFDVTVPMSPALRRAGRLVFVTHSGDEIKVRYKLNLLGKIEFEAPDKPGVSYYIDKATAPRLPHIYEEVGKAWLWMIYGTGTYYLSFVAAAAVVVLLIRFFVGLFTKSYQPEGPMTAFILVVFLIVMGRLLLFTFVDASSGPVTWTLRYTYPISHLYMCLLLLVIWQAGRVLLIKTPPKMVADYKGIPV